MTVETSGFISDLETLWPTDDDFINEGAGHIRLLKETLQTFQFPNLSAAVTVTADEINALTGAESVNPLQAQIDALIAAGNRETGEIRMWGGTGVPASGRWLLCDGGSYSRTVYADLYAVILTTYGAPSGSTFSVPDMRGRSPVGPGTDGVVDTQTLGAKDGASNVTLTADQSGLPVHNHGITPGNFVTTGAGTAGADGVERANVQNTDNAGGQAASQSHENQSPVLGVNFIIAISEADYARANP